MTGNHLSLLPIMARGKMDYVNGSYNANIEKHSSGGIKVTHSLAGENLVAQLVKEQKAIFACEVISPQTTYRTIETSQDAEQIINWNKGDVVMDELKFHPMVLASVKTKAAYKLESKHGVHVIWQGREIQIQKGTLLADDGFFDSTNSTQKLFLLKKNEDFLSGVYRVAEAPTETEFKFEILMASDLFDAMQSPHVELNFKHAIQSGFLSRALDILHSKKSENEEPWGMQYKALEDLAEEFESKNIPLWGDENFHADECATLFRPIKIDGDQNDDE